MLKIKGKLQISSWRGFYRREHQGRMVEVIAHEPTDEEPVGEVQVILGRRIRYDEWREPPTFAITYRKGSLFQTTFSLSPASAVLLRDTLNRVIDGTIEDVE